MQLILTPPPKVVVILKEISFNCGSPAHAKATQTEEPPDKVSAVNVSSQLHIQVFYIKCFICTSIMPFIFK